MPITQPQLPALARQPAIMPVMGLVFGLLLWVFDAAVDVYMLGEEQDLIQNIILPDEPTELWMRTLVVCVCLIMGFLSRHILLKHIELDHILREHKKELENAVEQRTRELVQKTSDLERQANTDSLTGLYNRRKFNNVLDNEMMRFNRYKHPLCLLLIDIDHFKLINDTYGHDVGDEVIIELAEILKTGVRSTDCVARWGGEEFLLLCIELDYQQAYQLAEKLRKLIKQKKFSAAINATASIGIAQIEVDDDIEAILKRADLALYTAKNNGRDRVCSANSDKDNNSSNITFSQ